MATYYVSPSGSDSNNGLGPDASHASNKPWLTLGKVLGASGFASGDTAYVAPGVYREVVTVAMTSAVAETKVLGDPLNAQGFKNGSGVLLAPGSVRWTAHTTNDTTAPPGTSTLDLSARDFLTFENLVVIGGDTQNSVILASAHSRNCTFRRCLLWGAINRRVLTFLGTANESSDWLIEQCLLFGAGSTQALYFSLPRSASADYDANILVRNCLILGASTEAIQVASSGASSFKAGGVEVWNCQYYGRGAILRTEDANLSTSIPCAAYNNAIWTTGTALNANTSGQITEDYNLIWAGTARANVTAGSNSITGPTYAFLVHVGGEWLTRGARPRPFGMPRAGSPLLGFGNQASGPTTDLTGLPRPAGGESTSFGIGSLERHDSGTKAAAADSDGGSGAAILLTGPGDQRVYRHVDAASTTLSVKVKWDSNHADTNKPQAVLEANTEIGVSTETKTATGSAGSGYETLTFSSFTPTTKGWVTLRLVSRSAAGNGKAWFDTVGVA